MAVSDTGQQPSFSSAFHPLLGSRASPVRGASTYFTSSALAHPAWQSCTLQLKSAPVFLNIQSNIEKHHTWVTGL